MASQYSLARILGIWALAAIPMGILSWIVFPALSPDANPDPLRAGVIRIVLLTCGLIWLFVLSMIIVRQEEGDLAYPSLRFGSTWMGVIVHSAQSVFFAFLILGVVLGLA